MSTTTPLKDGINALTAYANEVTGASDTTLSDAIATLASGYGSGGGNLASGTFTLEEDQMSYYTVTNTATLGFIPVLFFVNSDYISNNTTQYGILNTGIIDSNGKSLRVFTRYSNTSGGVYSSTNIKDNMSTFQSGFMYITSSGNINIGASETVMLLGGVTYTWYAIA